MADEIKTVVVTEIVVETKDAVDNLDKLETAQKDVVNETDKATESTQDYTGALDGMIDNLGVLPAGMTKGLKGVTGLTKGFKGLKIAIIATGIGALIVALGALFTWFNRTSEGQEVMRKGLAGIGAVVDVLLDTFADLGKFIFDAFENPKESLISLKDGIVTFAKNVIGGFINTWKSLGKIISSALKMDWDGVKQGASEGKDALIQMYTGTTVEQRDAFYDGIKKKMDEVNDKTREAIALQDRANALEREQIAFVTEEAIIRAKISEARLLANSKEKELTAQLVGAMEAVRLTNELYDNQIKLQAETVSILEEQQALGHNTLEDDRALQEEKKKLIELDKQRNDQLRALQMRRTSIMNEQKKEVEAREKEFQDELLMIEAELNAELEAEIKNAEEIEKIRIKQQIATDKRRAQDLKDEEALQQAKLQLAQDQLSALGDILGVFAEHSKALAIGEVLINAAVATIGAFKLTNPFLIGAQLFAIGVATAKSISEIHKAEDGMLVGQPHSRGGVPIIAEGGEAILNKRSMADPFLRSLASDINVAGGGIPFAQSGMLVGQSATTSAINSMNRQLNQALNNQRTVLVLEDFHSAENKVIVSEQISTL